MDLHGQRNAAPDDDGSMVLGSEINHVVGTAPTLLARPPGRRVLHLMADKGGWRMALGDRTASMPGRSMRAPRTRCSRCKMPKADAYCFENCEIFSRSERAERTDCRYGISTFLSTL